MTASHEGSFTLWIDASRYGTAGRYLEAALPSAAVIVTSQHSGSAHYYTGRPVLRWDALHVGLDEAVDALARLGRPSVLLVEDWEEAALRGKFPGSTLARLDWPARADFGSTTHVRLFDPADREQPTAVRPIACLRAGLRAQESGIRAGKARGLSDQRSVLWHDSWPSASLTS